MDPQSDPSSYLKISSSLIVANTASEGSDISGKLISGSYNLLTNIASGIGLDAITDRQVTLTNLKLDTALHSNGGPTQTLALLSGSPAIDTIPLQACSITITDPASGHTITIASDQRGDSRPDELGNACDVGAYESAY